MDPNGNGAVGVVSSNGKLAPLERIEAAALDLFADRGFQATTVRVITTACGLTPGALYNHFPSKDELLLSVIEQAHDELDRYLTEALAAAGTDPVDRLRELATAFALFHTRCRKEATVANREYPALSAAGRGRIVARRRGVRAIFEQVLTEGLEQGVFSIPGEDGPDVQITTTTIVNMGVMIAAWFRPHGRLRDVEVARLHAELTLRMVVVPST